MTPAPHRTPPDSRTQVLSAIASAIPEVRAAVKAAASAPLPEPVRRVLSMGGGVNTAAALIRYADHYSHCVFADTGGELQETYRYIDKYLKPFCLERGIVWATVRRPDEKTLEQYCLEKKMIPTRSRRWCTDKFKKRPLRKYLRDVLHATPAAPVRMDIGIAFDESHRARFTDDPAYIQSAYPLLDDRITRSECVAIIERHGWPAPPKSGCDFCMNRPWREFVALSAADPARFAAIMAMEKNNAQYPKMFLSRRPLATLSENTRLPMYPDDDSDAGSCDEGYCMV